MKEALIVANKYLSNDCILVGYEIFSKLENEKRSAWDSSKHLVIYFKDAFGDLCRLVASHQNNQSIKLHQYNLWFMEGFEHLKGSRPTVDSNQVQFHWDKRVGVYEKIEST